MVIETLTENGVNFLPVRLARQFTKSGRCPPASFTFFFLLHHAFGPLPRSRHLGATLHFQISWAKNFDSQGNSRRVASDMRVR
jgi:hypothetical protein